MEKKSSFFNIISFVLFLAVFCLGLLGLYKLFSWKDTSGVYFNTMKQVKNLEDNSVDVVFLGPSHTYCGINPNVFWDKYGYSTFDMSISGMDMYCTYYYLKEFLKKQSPKVVFVEASNISYGGHQVQGNVYRAVLSMPNREYAKALLDTSVATAFVENKDEKTYELVWPIIHTRYKELKKFDFIKNPLNQFGLGFTSVFNSSDIVLNEDALERNDLVELDATQTEWIDKVVELSKEYGFEIFYYNTPETTSDEGQAVLNSVYRYLDEKYGIKGFDAGKMMDEVGVDVSGDFSDPGHLNSFGAEKLSTFFADFLNENFLLPDHRGDEYYDYWEKCSYFNSKQWFDHNIFEEESRKKIVKEVAGTDGLLTVLSVNGATGELWGLVEEEVEEYFRINSSDVQNGGLFVFKNHELIWKADNSNLAFRERVNSDTYMQIDCSFDENGKLNSQIRVGQGGCVVQDMKGTYLTIYDLDTDTLAAVKKLD